MKKGTLVTVIGQLKGRVPVGEYIGRTSDHYIIREAVNGIDTLVAYHVRSVTIEEVIIQ